MKNKLFLTESEKSRISGLHRKAIITESKNMLNEATLVDIQNLLKTKGLDLGPKGADGKLGPFTLNAIYSALTQTQGTTPQQDNKIHNAQVVGAPNEADLQKMTPKMMNDMINGQPATGTQNPSGGFKLAVNMEGKGIMQDEAENKTYSVVSVKPLDCDVTEVVFKGPKQNDGKYLYPQIFAYYKTSEGSTGPAADRKEINFRSVGDGVQKSNNPCTEFTSFSNFGTLQFS